MIHTGFHVSRATQGLALHAHRLRIRGFHPLRPDFPVRSAHLVHGFWRPYYPTHALRHAWFGLFPVRSPLLGESLLFSLPAGTKMFQFPAFAFRIERNAVPSRRRVVPFGDPRITGHLHLHAAFRSLSRPSSPARAKASSVRPFFLFLCHTYSSVHPYQVAYILSAVFCPTPKGGDTFFIAFACPKCHRSLIALPAHVTASNGRERILVENNGFEPLTLCVQSRCSSQLS